jgi:hypothetical protein
MPVIGDLLRHVVDNRRRHRRNHRVFDVIIRDERNQILFRGKTRDVSKSGAKLAGLPVHTGLCEGQLVVVDIQIPPKVAGEGIQHLVMAARVMRVDETNESYTAGVRFDRELIG